MNNKLTWLGAKHIYQHVKKERRYHLCLGIKCGCIIWVIKIFKYRKTNKVPRSLWAIYEHFVSISIYRIKDFCPLDKMAMEKVWLSDVQEGFVLGKIVDLTDEGASVQRLNGPK